MNTVVHWWVYSPASVSLLTSVFCSTRSAPLPPISPACHWATLWSMQRKSVLWRDVTMLARRRGEEYQVLFYLCIWQNILNPRCQVRLPLVQQLTWSSPGIPSAHYDRTCHSKPPESRHITKHFRCVSVQRNRLIKASIDSVTHNKPESGKRRFSPTVYWTSFSPAVAADSIQRSAASTPDTTAGRRPAAVCWCRADRWVASTLTKTFAST